MTETHCYHAADPQLDLLRRPAHHLLGRLGRVLGPARDEVRLPRRDDLQHLGADDDHPGRFHTARPTLGPPPCRHDLRLLIGLTGAGGQLILFQALTMGPAYLIFPIISISPAITVMMAMVLLRERLKPLAVVGLVMALAAIVLFTITGGEAEESSGRGCCWRS